MPKNYLPYELSLELHKKGYTRPTSAYYNIYNKSIFFQKTLIHSEAIFAPTFGETIDWFKDIHNMDVNPTIESIKDAIGKLI